MRAPVEVSARNRARHDEWSGRAGSARRDRARGEAGREKGKKGMAGRSTAIEAIGAHRRRATPFPAELFPPAPDGVTVEVLLYRTTYERREGQACRALRAPSALCPCWSCLHRGRLVAAVAQVRSRVAGRGHGGRSVVGGTAARGSSDVAQRHWAVNAPTSLAGWPLGG